MELVPSRLALLTRQFLRRFLDNDLISPDGDTHLGPTHAVAAVAVAGLMVFVTVTLKYSPFCLTWPQVVDMSFVDAAFYVCMAMILFGLAATLSWDAFFLDSRDQVVLGCLPVSPRLLSVAKLAALGVFLAVLTVAANLVPILFAPALMLRSVRGATLAHWVLLTRAQAAATFAAGVWAALAVVALRGMLGCVLSARLLRRIGPPIQTALVLVFLGWFVLLPEFLRQATSAWYAGGWLRDASPPFWFIGLHRALVGQTDPACGPMVRAALVALTTTLGAVIVLYLAWPPRRQFAGDSLSARRGPARTPGRRFAGAALARLFAGRPLAHAAFDFTVKGFQRSGVHRLYLAAAAGTGLAWAAGGVFASIRGVAIGSLRTPSAATLQVQLVLTLLTVAAVRLGVGMPVTLKANWLFRLTEHQPAAPYHQGTRWAAFAIGAWPVVVLAPLHAWLWGWSIGLYHALVGACYGACAVELLFATRTAIPFTVPHVSGSLRLKTRWPVYVFAPTILAGAPAFMEHALLQQGGMAALPPILLAGLAFALALARRRGEHRRANLVFEEPPLDAFQTLALFE
jgi:hypothetical protein